MDSQPISDELIAWARLVGYAFSVESPSGGWIFWSEGGGDRLYIRTASDDSGWFNVTEASRSEDESFFYAASTLHVAERYLWGFFGMIFRDSRRMPRLPIPFDRAAVADPYRIESQGNSSVLLDGDKPVMRAGRSSTKVAILVRTSYWLKVTVEDLEHAYRDPEGRPLFSLGK
jgi:hypothetical protein